MEVGAELSFAYLSREAGSIVRVNEFDPDSIYEWLARTGHVQMIPTLPSQDIYLWMVEFAENEPAGRLREMLLTSLSGVSAVWKFRNVLYHEDAANARWEKLKRAKLVEAALNWMDASPQKQLLPE